MSPELLALAKAYFEPHEGRIPHMYQCIHGQVTAGIGHLFASPPAASKLLWEHEDGTFAGDAEVRLEFAKIRALPYGKDYPASFYEIYTRLRLTDQRIDGLFLADLLEAERLLAETRIRGALAFPEYDRWPAKIQLAMLDMMFSIGPAFMGSIPPKAYPKLVAAAQRGDWATCAEECKRGGVAPRRDDALKALFESAIPSAIPTKKE